MLALKISNGNVPPLNSALVFELYKINTTDSSDWEKNSLIRIFFQNETESDHYYQLKTPECKDFNYCPIKQFEKTIHDLALTQTEWKNECETVEKSPKDNEFYRSINTGKLKIIYHLMFYTNKLFLHTTLSAQISSLPL